MVPNISDEDWGQLAKLVEKDVEPLVGTLLLSPLQ
jgi:hypothetical protein